MEEEVANDVRTAALCALSVLGLFSNGLIFALLYKKQNMRTFSNRFVLSLAGSHLLQCIFIIPAMLASTRGVVFSRLWCRITTSLTICLNLASVFSILLIAIDRNCAVNSPLHYTITITKKRTSVLIGAVWLAALVLSLPVLFGIPESSSSSTLQSGELRDSTSLAYGMSVAFVGFVVPFVNVTSLYVAMFRAARNNNARARRSSSNSSGSNEVIVNLKPFRKQGATEYTIRRNFSSDKVDANSAGCCFVGKHKAAVTGLLVVLSFATCWLPYFTTLISDTFLPMSQGMRYCVHIAAYTSCVLNPYIYFFRNKNAWREAKKLLAGCCISRNKFDHNRNAKKSTIDMSPSLFRIPTSLSQSVLTMNTTNLSALCSDPSNRNMSLQAMVYPEKTTLRQTRGVFSLEPAKPLLHQDSSSSNDSNDACTTSVIMDSGLSMDEDSTIWFHPFQSGMVDVPLHDVAELEALV